MKRQPTITDIIMLAGGAITFLASFLTFWDAGDDQSAWGTFAFPTFTIPAILGLAMAAMVLVEWFAAPSLPKVLTFDWKQIYVTWGIVSLVIVLSAFALKDGPDTGIGTILMLLGTAAMTAGAVMRILGVANDPLGGAAATAPGALQAPGGYPAQPGGAYPPQQPGYTPAPPAGQYPPQGQTTPPPPPPPPAGGASTSPPPPPV